MDKAKNIALTTLRVAGPVLLVLGFLYWFGGLHPKEWKQNQLFYYFPDISNNMIIPITIIWQKLDSVSPVGINGKFGIQLIAAAFVTINISKPLQNGKYALKSLYTVAKMILLVILAWHWLVQSIEGSEMFDGMIYLTAAFFVCVVLGKIAGKIYRKIYQVIRQKGGAN